MWKKGVITGCAAVFAVALVACASHTANSSSDEASAVAGDPSVAAYTSWEQWKDEFPDQVSSFYSGRSETEVDGKVHSHAFFNENLKVYYMNGDRGPSMAESTGMVCSSCKSTSFNTLYDEMGMDAYTASWDENVDTVDWWDCGLCHVDGDPTGELAYATTNAKRTQTSLLDTLPASQAVCGQCHGAMTMTAMLLPEGSDLYKYGTNPGALLQFALENGVKTKAAAGEAGEAGLEVLNGLNHSDLELFQGGVHAEQGLGCTDCHMPKKTNADGEEYTSHDASSTPLENEEALEYCLTCHTSQGVNSTDEMKQFILDAQAEIAEMKDNFNEVKTQFEQKFVEAWKSGSVDEATLEEGRDAYLHANFYLRYCGTGSEEIPGQKVAHNPEMMRSYIEQATAMLEDNMAKY